VIVTASPAPARAHHHRGDLIAARDDPAEVSDQFAAHLQMIEGVDVDLVLDGGD